MVPALKLAITGATGFVGTHLLDLATSEGHDVRALTRREQSPRDSVTWVEGALDVPEALSTLVEGADAVIHVAGVINSPDAAGFDRGNVAGTAAMLAAARGGGVGRFVHVSSLAAREPGLSLYGASKARSEALVTAAGLPGAIVRPPAVYGPGDRETLELFRMARRGLILLPPSGRLSLIHVSDLARLLLALGAPDAPSGLLIEPDDGQANGWTHREFAAALGRAVGRRAAAVSTPRSILALAGRADRLIRGDKAKMTPDRAAYFAHPDWTVSTDRAAPPAFWSPRVMTDEGLTQTAAWYREAGWL